MIVKSCRQQSFHKQTRCNRKLSVLRQTKVKIHMSYVITFDIWEVCTMSYCCDIVFVSYNWPQAETTYCMTEIKEKKTSYCYCIQTCNAYPLMNHSFLTNVAWSKTAKLNTHTQFFTRISIYPRTQSKQMVITFSSWCPYASG